MRYRIALVLAALTPVLALAQASQVATPTFNGAYPAVPETPCDVSGNCVTTSAVSGRQALDVNVAGGAAQGTAAAVTGAWPVKVTDGTNTTAVKAASTAPTGTEPAVVVVQSPNGGNPCSSPSATLQMVTGSASGTTATQIIALSGSTKIYVCAINFGTGTGAGTISLLYGTGTNCATGQAILMQAFSVPATSALYLGPVVGVTPAGNALCYIQTGTTPTAKYTVTYVQQ